MNGIRGERGFQGEKGDPAPIVRTYVGGIELKPEEDEKLVLMYSGKIEPVSVQMCVRTTGGMDIGEMKVYEHQTDGTQLEVIGTKSFKGNSLAYFRFDVIPTISPSVWNFRSDINVNVMEIII